MASGIVRKAMVYLGLTDDEYDDYDDYDDPPLAHLLVKLEQAETRFERIIRPQAGALLERGVAEGRFVIDDLETTLKATIDAETKALVLDRLTAAPVQLHNEERPRRGEHRGRLFDSQQSGLGIGDLWKQMMTLSVANCSRPVFRQRRTTPTREPSGPPFNAPVVGVE